MNNEPIEQKKIVWLRDGFENIFKARGRQNQFRCECVVDIFCVHSQERYF